MQPIGMMKLGFLAVIALTFLQELEAWAPVSPISRRGFRSSSSASTLTARNMVESVSVEGMGDNHEAVGLELAGSVQRWLDAEWMPQEVHVQIGESCKKTYMQCRQEGEADLMSVMMQIADDLQENWNLYDKDAFVNAYDISNYVSDYFQAKSGVDDCGCASKIY
jgi:hypothetical protein